jgi:hypothetical protein
MTGYLVKRTGKLLFPHLARDQRKQKMTTILLVLGISLSIAYVMAMLMKSSRY